MKQQIILEITADVPEEHPDMAHEAIISIKAPMQTIIDALTAMGLVNVQQIRRIGRVRGPKTAPVPTPEPMP